MLEVLQPAPCDFVTRGDYKIAPGIHESVAQQGTIVRIR
jgi:hypothetical protein